MCIRGVGRAPWIIILLRFSFILFIYEFIFIFSMNEQLINDASLRRNLVSVNSCGGLVELNYKFQVCTYL